MVKTDHCIARVALKVDDLVNAKDSLSSRLEIEIERRSGGDVVFESVVVEVDGLSALRLNHLPVARLRRPREIKRKMGARKGTFPFRMGHSDSVGGSSPEKSATAVRVAESLKSVPVVWSTFSDTILELRLFYRTDGRSPQGLIPWSKDPDAHPTHSKFRYQRY
jgi:hypothetical protein